jgi:hypothetical protein
LDGGGGGGEGQQQPLQQQQAGQQQHQPRDSSLAMATAGPTGTRSGTVSTHSGTVDMSIHNESNRSGAGSQAEAALPAAGGSHAGGWAGDEYEDDGDSQVGQAYCWLGLSTRAGCNRSTCLCGSGEGACSLCPSACVHPLTCLLTLSPIHLHAV